MLYDFTDVNNNNNNNVVYMGKTLKYDLGLFPTVFRLFLGAKAPLILAHVKKNI